MTFHHLSVIITGAGNGIGRELSIAYGKAGARITLADVDAEKGESAVTQILADGGVAQFVRADMRYPMDIAALIESAVTTYGTVDILINNAGIGRWNSPYELSLEDWDDVLHTNLRGTFLCAREAAKRMRQDGRGGSIVNLASTRAFMSEPNSEAYAASKGGIVALTHALAVSLGPDNIRVNCISPGWIETGDYDVLRDVDHTQHPAGRVGSPADIVKACFYLTDPSNQFVTGTNLNVDGGMTHKMIYEP
ncbi:UNVERIFIED_CONTAM: NAD(P)-dependent dehydrogenase (short-subunit alcohol dehydrogenase family) [Brevibacillus sp. OAP136]